MSTLKAKDDAARHSARSSLIVLDHVGATYETDDGNVEAVRDVSLTIADGEFIAFLGPSGCGKSTLLRLVAGLRRASQGTIFFEGRPIAGPLRSVGMVFQSPVLLPWRRIIDNILVSAELAGLRRRDHMKRAYELLDLTGLREFATRFPRELSGGMQQRASLCRALLLDPPVLLMDEPFGALDAMTRDEMNLELLRIWGRDGKTRKTILFVTHSIPEAIFLADRVVVMTSRPGRIGRIFDVRLPRPRSVQQRAQSEFGQLLLEVYETLKVAHPGSGALL